MELGRQATATRRPRSRNGADLAAGLRKRFGENLRVARERGGLSQAELGRAAGVSPSEVSRLEAGVREPRLTTIVLLASALELDGRDLLVGLD